MTTIVTRASKGSALTWTEGDANITNLNNDKLEAGPAANAALTGFTTTTTAAGTTILDNTSSVYQLFIGGLTQIIRLPDTATLTTGWSFHIVNNSIGNLTLQTSTSLSFITIIPGTTVMATCISTASNSTGSWEAGYTDFSTATGTGAVVLNSSPTISAATLSGATSSTGSLGLKDIRETVAALTYGATITPNAADGSVRTITLTGNVTFSAFTSPVSGQTITLIITQDATGSRTLTSTMKFAGGVKTLSTAANSIDILTVSYIGTTYYASLAKGFA